MIKLSRYLKPYYSLLVLVIILAAGQVSSNLYLPNLMSDIVTYGISAFNTNYIWRKGLVMIAVAIGGTVCAIIGIFLSSRIATGLSKKLRADIFNTIQRFSLHEFDAFSSASLITRTTNDTAQVQQVLVMILNMMITAPITLIVGIILALDQDVGLSWILVVIMPILVAVVALLLIKAVPYFTSMQIKLDKLNLILDENLTGVRVVRAFNRIKHEEKRFDIASYDVTDTAIKVNQLVAFMMPTMMLLINMSSVAIVWFGSLRVAEGTLQTGAMFAFLQYIMQILIALLMLAMIFILVPRAEASAQRINEIFDLDPEISDAKKTKQIPQGKASVEFKNVSFAYHGAEQPALYNISFRTSSGQVTAIIGGTGSGKSTLINLIPRFFDVTEGQVLVNGVDTRELRQDDLRAKIGFVPQKAVLFSGTIKENLLYGKEDATDTEIEHAAEIAQATEFIKKMPETFSSSIAQGGTNVSGGQMQRLSIARALIRKPEIYIFDDTFSALDFKTDAKLRTALKTETKGATVIIVAQRVSTVMDADQIIVLDEGRIAGIGKHSELMKTCHVYSDIVSSQLSVTEIKEKSV